jgi:hypothetical protein
MLNHYVCKIEFLVRKGSAEPLESHFGNHWHTVGTCQMKWQFNHLDFLCDVQGGSNMTGTNCDLFTHK